METKKVLLTGGMGYIGSHTAVELIQAGYEVALLDNLYNSKITVLDKIEQITGVRPQFYAVDLRNAEKVEEVFAQNDFSAVIHFAGLKAVAESVEKPLDYYDANVCGTINLLQAMRQHEVLNLIFSSSATVYGDPVQPLCVEDLPTGRGLTNPYGRTKYFIEEILKDLAASDERFHITLLRYFNPVGAHSSGLLGEDPNGRPNNLMPIVMKVAQGEIPELSVYGNDYDTPDGSCVRDYIHVVDLAKGHLAALRHIDQANVQIYNLGTGRGTSVFEMIQAFSEASGKPLPHKVVERRAGDLPVLRADATRAERELGWKATLTVSDAMRDTLNFLAQNADSRA